jgi:hypothetical protein
LDAALVFVEPVFNIEVDGDHVYRVGEQGLLVHNMSQGNPAGQPPSSTWPWDLIDAYRQMRGMPILGAQVPVPQDELQTVAFIQEGGNIYWGVNSTERSVQEDAVAKQVFSDMKAANAFDPYKVPFYGAGASNFLTHGEAFAIISYYKLKGGPIPSTFNCYVDRHTCRACLKFLPLLLKYLNIAQIVFYSKDGLSETVNAAP